MNKLLELLAYFVVAVIGGIVALMLIQLSFRL